MLRRAFVTLSILAAGNAAALVGDRVEINMYGRMGLAWAPTTGQVIQGRSMNLLGNSTGGRFEEGDYLEPKITLHILRAEPGKEGADKAPYAYVRLTPGIFARGGSFIGVFTTNNWAGTVGWELFEAYLEAGNVLVPDLKFWVGARFYRGGDVHIADQYYFNDLNGQGAGAMYGPLDVAVLLQTGTDAFHNWDSDGNGSLDAQRQRTVFVGQYVYKLGNLPVSLHGLGEFHLLPEARLANAATPVLPTDFGWVLGVKAHLEWGKGSFNDLAIRYGSRLASGSRGGSRTWYQYGTPNAEGVYDTAGGLEVVDHLVYNVNPLLSLNGYGILHFNSGYVADGAGLPQTASSVDWAVGLRSFLYLHDNFHLINEASFQVRKDGIDALPGSAFKFSIVPTLVPTGERSVWARPHLRLIYTLAVYNQVAVDNLYSPYLKALGASSIGHYLGTRAEWWF